MVLKSSSILVCIFASLAAAVPLGTGSTSSGNIHKRHKTPPTPALVPEAMALDSGDQVIVCIFNYVLQNASTSDKHQLPYQELVKGCQDAVAQQQQKDNGTVDAVLLPGPILLPQPPADVVDENAPKAPPLTDTHPTPATIDNDPKASTTDDKDKPKNSGDKDKKPKSDATKV